MRWYKVEFLRDYLRLFCIHPILLLGIYIFRWYYIKYEIFFDPMEKIWVKKELYKERYEFLNFMEFSRFYFDFLGIFWIFWISFLFKKEENHGEKIVASWPTWISQSQRLNHPSANQTVHDFHDEISYRNPCSSFVNLTFDWIVKRLRNFGVKY